MLKWIGEFLLPPDIELRKRRLELIVWAFVLSLSFYSSYLGWLAWVSLARPFMILSQLRGRPLFNAAYLFGFFFTLFTIYWVSLVSPPGMVAAVVIVGFYYAILLYFFGWLYQIRPWLGITAAPFLWTGLEHLRTLSEFAFPWSDIGYTQSYYLYFLQFVSVASVHGLTFLLVLVNVLLWQILRKEVSPERKLTSFFASLAILAGLAAYGWVVLPPYPEEGDIDITILQGSIPIDVKWAKGNESYSLDLYDSLTQANVDSSTKLVLWPETSIPCYLSHTFACRSAVGEIARKSGTYHLAGAMGATPRSGGEDYRYHNSCYQIGPTGTVEARYDKRLLVPFAEHVPYQDYLPFLEKGFLREYLTFIDQVGVQWWSDFYPGDTNVIFETPDMRYACLICFETAFPEFVRTLIHQGADFIVGITNDTWFGRSVGIHMHSQMFITRAVENRCWFARSANSGLSYVVDGYGRMWGELPIYQVAALKGKVGKLDGYSFFTEHGDVIGRLSLLITTLCAAIFLVQWLFVRFFSH